MTDSRNHDDDQIIGQKPLDDTLSQNDARDGSPDEATHELGNAPVADFDDEPDIRGELGRKAASRLQRRRFQRILCFALFVGQSGGLAGVFLMQGRLGQMIENRAAASFVITYLLVVLMVGIFAALLGALQPKISPFSYLCSGFALLSTILVVVLLKVF
ncbi:MAG: hypothetical protein AAGF15_07460 [Pseudomonadota bacterium]